MDILRKIMRLRRRLSLGVVLRIAVVVVAACAVLAEWVRWLAVP